MTSIGTPHRHNAGYFCNDVATSRRQEADVQICRHCEAVIKMQEWIQDGGWCSRCQSPLCNNLACRTETARMGCVPFIKKLEANMERAVKLEQHLKIAGLEPPVSPQPIYTG